jgi:hypothetical protein
MAASGLLALALAPATALTAQHGMPMGDPDDMPMMQQRGGMGMMGPGMQGGWAVARPMMQGQGMGMMGPGGMMGRGGMMGMMGHGGMGMMGPGGMMGHGGMGMMGPAWA